MIVSNITNALTINVINTNFDIMCFQHESLYDHPSCLHPNTKTHNLLQRVGLIFSPRIVHLQTTIILSVQKSETTTIHRLYLTLFTYKDFPHKTRKSCWQEGTEYHCPVSTMGHAGSGKQPHLS